MKRMFALLFLIFSPSLFGQGVFPTADQVRAAITTRDSIKSVVLGEYISGQRALDYRTEIAWNSIVNQVLKDFEGGASSWGRVLISFGSIDSLYYLDREKFLCIKLQEECKKSGWALKSWLQETIVSRGATYQWLILPQ